MATVSQLNNPADILVSIVPDPSTFETIQEVRFVINGDYIVLFYINDETTPTEYNGPFILRETSALRIEVYDSTGETLLGQSVEPIVYTSTTKPDEGATPPPAPSPAVTTITATDQESMKNVADRARVYATYSGKIVERGSNVLKARGQEFYSNQDDVSNPTIAAIGSLAKLPPSMLAYYNSRIAVSSPKPLLSATGIPLGSFSATGTGRPIEYFQILVGLSGTAGSVQLSDTNNTKIDYYGYQWCASFVTACWIEGGAAVPGTDNTGFICNWSQPGSITFVNSGNTVARRCSPGTVGSWVFWGAIHGNFYQPKEIANNPVNAYPGSALILYRSSNQEDHIEQVIEGNSAQGLVVVGGNTTNGKASRGSALWLKYYSTLNDVLGFVRPWPYTTRYDYYDNFDAWKNAVIAAGYQVSTEIKYDKGTLRYYRAIKTDPNTKEQTWVGGWARGGIGYRSTYSPLQTSVTQTGVGSIIKTI
jgi:hypothetical protein